VKIYIGPTRTPFMPEDFTPAQVARQVEKIRKVLSEDEFGVMFTDCSEKLIVWIKDNTSGVDNRIATFFIQDFIAQTLSNAYDVKEVDTDSKTDVMFG
jgi:predicted component of type VI protein secretion system